MSNRNSPLLVDPPMELGTFEKYLTIWVFVAWQLGLVLEN